MIYIGVDPGKTGAVAVIDTRGHAAVRQIPYDDGSAQPDVMALAVWLTEHIPNGSDGPEPAVCCLELVNSFKMGRQSAFVFGQGWGALQAMLSMRGIPYRLVRPQDWQKVVMRGLAEGSEIPTAKGLFPTVEWPKNKAICGGMADALLIAQYAKQMSRNEPD